MLGRTSSSVSRLLSAVLVCLLLSWAIGCGDDTAPSNADSDSTTASDSTASDSQSTESGSTTASSTDSNESSTAPSESGSSGTAALLVETGPDWGIDFVHRSGAGGDLLFPEMMGGGIAVFDADADGDLDLYFVNGADNSGSGTSSLMNRLYVQENGKFQDGTASSGLGDKGYGTGVAVGDMNNDGHEDVFVSNIGADQLYAGQGAGTFKNVTEAAGLTAEKDADLDWSTSAAFCDIDRDG